MFFFCKFFPQTPDEDEETRQYRLKIEEQKRLREEILRRKEMRRQMQAGVRKKELLDRLNSQTNAPNQAPTPTQTQPIPLNQQQQPLQQQPLLQQPEPNRPPLLTQQPKLVSETLQQSLNHTLTNPNQNNTLPLSGAAQTPTPRLNVKARLHMVKGSTPEQQIPNSGTKQQWNQPQLNRELLQQNNSSVQSVNRPNTTIQSLQVPQMNTPVGQDPALIQGPKPGAKRTVMQRVRSSSLEGQQVPQKVRVVKLSGQVSV